MNKRYYITTPIYYVNGVPHCGTATTTLLADATKRYRSLRGDNPYFLTGTDENARKVTEAAEKAGYEAKAFVDMVSHKFVETWRFLKCDYDVFFRTTEERHTAAVQEVFKRLLASGDVYLGEYEGWYSVADETFFRDTDVDADKQIARETGAKVERVKEETYFFRLSAYGDRLKAYITENADFLIPETRKNEVLAFIEQGLRDIAITQNRSGWGIPVPGEEGRKIIYVWFDALINYLTESGWPKEGWESLWPADVHLMGKEIYTRFHATLWPAMLMALNLPLPKHVVGHGWWLVRDPETQNLVKGAKSGVPLPMPQEVVVKIQGASGASEDICIDAFRYYCLRDIAFQSDAEFSINMLVSRFNSDLANDLGNVLNRVLRAKYHTGFVPQYRALDPGLIETSAKTIAAYEAALERFDWGNALTAVWTLLGDINRYLAETAPWMRAKNGDESGVADAVYNALEATRLAAVLISPAMPFVGAEIGRQLGIADLAPVGSWAEVTKFGVLKPDDATGEATPLFPRIDPKSLQNSSAPAAPAAKETKEKKKETTVENAALAAEAPVAPIVAPIDEITIDDFMKVKFRVADILAAEKIEGAKKLLRLQIRVGANEERQIVSGIADSYAPEDLVGKQIVVVYNLKPAKLRGVESQGMLLAATDPEGKAILLHPDKPVPAGAEVR